MKVIWLEGSEFSWNYESIRILDVYLSSIVTLSTTMCTGKTVLPSQHTTRIHGNYTLSTQLEDLVTEPLVHI